MDSLVLSAIKSTSMPRGGMTAWRCPSSDVQQDHRRGKHWMHTVLSEELFDARFRDNVEMPWVAWCCSGNQSYARLAVRVLSLQVRVNEL
jgi:hypothetical protein